MNCYAATDHVRYLDFKVQARSCDELSSLRTEDSGRADAPSRSGSAFALQSTGAT